MKNVSSPCKLFCLLAICISGITSCTSDGTYLLKIENNTSYHLDSLLIGTKNGRAFSIAPMEASDTFTIREGWGHGFAPSEPLIGFHVIAYSDSASRYTNTMGRVISYHALRKDSLNRIVVTLINNSLYPSDKFTYSIQRAPLPENIRQ